jgi:hypothetical protein
VIIDVFQIAQVTTNDGEFTLDCEMDIVKGELFSAVSKISYGAP